jgi:lipopolysaccharide export LptBFGC system permease protein LptF
MKNFMNKTVNVIRDFNNDENGMETMQVVMLLAIAAIVGVAVYSIGKNIVTWGDKTTGNFMENSTEMTVESSGKEGTTFSNNK